MFLARRRLTTVRYPLCCTIAVTSVLCHLAIRSVQAGDGALDGKRHRVLVSTDIGGTDPDDFQSLVHLLLYADVLEIEGLVSSPYGPGRKEDILRVIDIYEKDYPKLRTYSDRYPPPDKLRAITKQGATESPGYRGVSTASEGSEWLIRCARRNDPRPLHVLVWGGIEDLAQALHDAPDILPKLRVYFIGGPNKMWSVDAYDYIEEHHPELWIIEANSTYRGWFMGGNQSDEWSNEGFVARHVAGHGAMGDFFASLLNGRMKMGDSPSVGWLLRGSPDDPSAPGWGGRFVRMWDGRKTVFERPTTEADKVEVFGVVEFGLKVPAGFTSSHSLRILFDNRVPASVGYEEGQLRFRFSPRDAKTWTYVIQGELKTLHGKRGAFTAVPPPPERTRRLSERHPNWWTDDPDPAVAEGAHFGAKTVNQWRLEFLQDFARRMDRCVQPASTQSTPLGGNSLRSALGR
ncbi:MAG: hypothetical protein KatS3mg109_1997 [Pirellulaceae bacterium]|nr:MAG: hypothetical protein KatS3mg109_1997 [Pirellulaceae bacterium]